MHLLWGPGLPLNLLVELQGVPRAQADSSHRKNQLLEYQA